MFCTNVIPALYQRQVRYSPFPLICSAPNDKVYKIGKSAHMHEKVYLNSSKQRLLIRYFFDIRDILFTIYLREIPRNEQLYDSLGREDWLGRVPLYCKGYAIILWVPVFKGNLLKFCNYKSFFFPFFSFPVCSFVQLNYWHPNSVYF